ncbi:MAG: tetratricopeptide repeat protein [bacterium]|nr:tetratricopeptide repeat protein [bacterium]
MATLHLGLAENWFLLAAKYEPENQQVWRNLGLIYEKQGRVKDAISAWIQVDDMAWQLFRYGDIEREANNLNSALNCYDLAEKTNPEVKTSVSYGRYLIYLSLDDPDRAVAELETAVRTDAYWPDNKTQFLAYLRLGIWLIEHDRPMEAEIILSKAVSTNGQNIDPTILSEAFRYLGLAQWHMDKLDSAIVSLRKSVQTNEQNIWAHIHYGKVLYLFDPTESNLTATEFARAIQLSPGNSDVRQNIVEFWIWVGEEDYLHSLCRQLGAENVNQPVKGCDN